MRAATLGALVVTTAAMAEAAVVIRLVVCKHLTSSYYRYHTDILQAAIRQV